MKKILLSLVIPIYNVELYVEKCLRSCAEQNLASTSYEIIVVNDGSPDGSLAIVERVAQEYSNITIVSQPNAGLSAARNKGISMAQGDYIWFIDSDDWIEPNCLNKIVQLCINHQLDLLHLCANTVEGNKYVRKMYYDDLLCNRLLTGKEFLGLYKSPCAQYNVVRRAFLQEKNLSFYNGIFHEDSEFTPRVIYLADRVWVLNDMLYYQYQNPNSITQSVNPKKSHDIIKVCRSLAEFTSKVEPRYKTKLYNCIGLNINNSLLNGFFMSKEEKKALNKAWYKNRDLLVYLLRSTILKYKIEGVLFLLFPKPKYVDIYQFLQKFNAKRI